jgi:hypothetical protein
MRHGNPSARSIIEGRRVGHTVRYAGMMSMSSANSGAGGTTSLPLPPPQRQIRFVNNEGQPPAKRRRINAAYVLSHLPKVGFC